MNMFLFLMNASCVSVFCFFVFYMSLIMCVVHLMRINKDLYCLTACFRYITNTLCALEEYSHYIQASRGDKNIE